MAKAHANGFDFTFTKSNKKGSHFTALSWIYVLMTTEWVEHIFKPYHYSVIKANPDLDDNQIFIVYLNCYPVHMSKEFHSYILNEFPYVVLCFIPAGCKIPLFSCSLSHTISVRHWYLPACQCWAQPCHQALSQAASN